ncbi:MAG: hypothetical protein ABIU87_01305 [Ornithinibacter sp.]
MGADRWDEQVGSVADEAARLLESLRRATAEDDDPGAETPPGERDGEHAHQGPEADSSSSSLPDGGHDPVCQWCPLCRSATVVRSLSPETLARLADLAVVAAGVLSDLAARQGRSGAGPEADGPMSGTDERATRRPTASSPPSRPVPVVDIDVSEEGPHA